MRLDNGAVWVEIPETYGPRITGFGLLGESSVFGDGASAERATPFGHWRAYGGHRLWVAPERYPETYRIDDAPPSVDETDGVCTLRRGPDALGMSTAISLAFDGTAARVNVQHTVRNDGNAAQWIAPWALTVMKPGGAGILPREPAASHAEALTPTGTLTLWAYARFDDPRVQWQRDALVLHCEPAHQTPWKAGGSGERGWCAYVVDGTAFVKRVRRAEDQPYPDRGSAIELFTNGEFFELETLAPLQRVDPGASVRHDEQWSLLRLDAARDPVAEITNAVERT